MDVTAVLLLALGSGFTRTLSPMRLAVSTMPEVMTTGMNALKKQFARTAIPQMAALLRRPTTHILSANTEVWLAKKT